MYPVRTGLSQGATVARPHWGQRTLQHGHLEGGGQLICRTCVYSTQEPTPPPLLTGDAVPRVGEFPKPLATALQCLTRLACGTLISPACVNRHIHTAHIHRNVACCLHGPCCGCLPASQPTPAAAATATEWSGVQRCAAAEAQHTRIQHTGATNAPPRRAAGQGLLLPCIAGRHAVTQGAGGSSTLAASECSATASPLPRPSARGKLLCACLFPRSCAAPSSTSDPGAMGRGSRAWLRYILGLLPLYLAVSYCCIGGWPRIPVAWWPPWHGAAPAATAAAGSTHQVRWRRALRCRHPPSVNRFMCVMRLGKGCRTRWWHALLRTLWYPLAWPAVPSLCVAVLKAHPRGACAPECARGHARHARVVCVPCVLCRVAVGPVGRSTILSRPVLGHRGLATRPSLPGARPFPCACPVAHAAGAAAGSADRCPAAAL